VQVAGQQRFTQDLNNTVKLITCLLSIDFGQSAIIGDLFPTISLFLFMRDSKERLAKNNPESSEHIKSPNFVVRLPERNRSQNLKK